MVAVKRNVAKSDGDASTIHAHTSPEVLVRSRTGSLKSSSSMSKSAPKSTRLTRQNADRNAPRTTKTRSRNIPRAAAWGWLHTPLPNRIMFFGVLFGLVGLTTPYWASVKSSLSGYASFGIWHFCVGDEPCSSIHENLLPGKRVPAWHTLVQGTFTIGVACSIVGLSFLTHCAQGMIIKMSPITHRTTVSILAIAAFQHLVALYVFVTYFEDHDFLCDANEYEKDLHGSFYCGVTSLVCLVVATLIVMFDDDITRTPKSFYYYNYRPVSYDSLSSLDSAATTDTFMDETVMQTPTWSVER